MNRSKLGLCLLSTGIGGAGFVFFLTMHQGSIGVSSGFLAPLQSTWRVLQNWFGFSLGYPPFDFPPGQHRLFYTTFFWACLYFYFVFYLKRTSKAVPLKYLMVLTTAVCLPLLFSPNLLSSDVFDYILHGRIVVLYHGNPYIESPSAFPMDPFLKLTWWGSYPAVYGPVWITTSSLLVFIAQIFHWSVAGHVFLFRFFGLFIHLLNGLLVWVSLSQLKVSDRQAGTAFYLLNPLAIVELVGNAHNDNLMIFFLLCGIVALKKDTFLIPIISFSLACLVKVTCLPILAIFSLSQIWRRAGPVRFLFIWAGSGIVAFLCYAPFWTGADTLNGVLMAPGYSSFTSSLGEYLYHSPYFNDDFPLLNLLGHDRREVVQRTLLMILAAITLVLLLRTRHPNGLYKAFAWFSFYWCIIGATWFMPWYVTMAIATAAISASWPVMAATGVLSYLAFWIYVPEAGGWPEIFRGFMSVHYAVVVFGIPLIVAALPLLFLRGIRQASR